MADEYQMWIGGEWAPSESRAVFDATSPSTGEVLGSVPEGTRADAQRAIDAASVAWTSWAAASPFDRAKVMEQVAHIIGDRRVDLARTLTLDQGKPLRAEAYDEVEELIAYFEMAAADARRMEGTLAPSVDADKRVLLYRVPRGVVSVISPWNWPYTMPGRSWLRPWRTATAWCGRRPPPRRFARSSWPSAWPTPACLPACST